MLFFEGTGVDNMKFYDEKRIASLGKVRTFTIILLIIPTFFMLAFIVIGLVDGDTGMLTTGIIFSTIFLGYFIAFPVLYSKFKVVPLYGKIVEEDHDGVIKISRISEMTGRSEEKVRSEIQKYIRSGLLMHMRYDAAQDAVLVGNAEDALESATPNFHQVICPTCGAENNVPDKGSAKCRHCGSYLRRA